MSDHRTTDPASAPAPAWLDDTESAAWRGMIGLLNHLPAQLNRELQRSCGLSMADYEVLVRLSEADDQRLRPFQLSERMQWEKSRLSHHLKRMQQRDLVCRQDCADDARGDYVALTEHGRQRLETAAPHHVDHVRRYLIDGLDQHQLRALTEISEHVLERTRGEAG